MAVNLRAPYKDWDACLGQGYDAPPVSVRPWHETGRERLRSFLADNRVYGHIGDLDDEEDGLAWLDRAFGNRHYRFFSILRVDDGIRVGFLVFQYLPGRGIRLGGAIDPDHWNRGYASAVISGLKVHLKGQTLSVPVFADIRPDNTAVRRAFEKAGCRLDQSSAFPEQWICILS